MQICFIEEEWGSHTCMAGGWLRNSEGHDFNSVFYWLEDFFNLFERGYDYIKGNIFLFNSVEMNASFPTIKMSFSFPDQTYLHLVFLRNPYWQMFIPVIRKYWPSFDVKHNFWCFLCGRLHSTTMLFQRRGRVQQSRWAGSDVSGLGQAEDPEPPDLRENPRHLSQGHDLAADLPGGLVRRLPPVPALHRPLEVRPRTAGPQGLHPLVWHLLPGPDAGKVWPPTPVF